MHTLKFEKLNLVHSFLTLKVNQLSSVDATMLKTVILHLLSLFQVRISSQHLALKKKTNVAIFFDASPDLI